MSTVCIIKYSRIALELLFEFELFLEWLRAFVAPQASRLTTRRDVRGATKAWWLLQQKSSACNFLLFPT